MNQAISNQEQTTPEVIRLLWVSAAISIGIFIFTYLFFVSTGIGQSFDGEAYLGHENVDRRVLSIDRHLLSWVSVSTMFVIALAILGLSVLRRRIEVGFVCVGGFAAAVIGAELFKRFLPWQQLSAVDRDLPPNLVFDTYPSGHTTIATTACLMLVVLSAPKIRPWVGILLGVVITVYATAVVIAGWHRPSDAIGGIAWSGAIAFVTILVAIRVSNASNIDQHSISLMHRIWNPTTPTALVVALIVLGGLAAAAYSTPGELADLDIEFVTMSALIVFGGMSLSVWTGQLMKQVHWSPHDQQLAQKAKTS